MWSFLFTLKLIIMKKLKLIFCLSALVFSLQSKAQDLLFRSAWFQDISVSGVCYDDEQNFYAVMSILKDTDIDPGPQVAYYQGGLYNIVLAKYDNNGAYQWSLVLPESYFSFAPKLGYFDGEIGLCGTAESEFSVAVNGENKVIQMGASYVMKVTKNGKIRLVESFQSFVKDAAFNDLGEILILGLATEASDVAPGSAVHMLGGEGAHNYVSKLNANGELLWAKEMPSESGVHLFGIKASANGECMLLGSFLGNFDADPGPGADYFENSSGAEHALLILLSDKGAYRWGMHLNMELDWNKSFYVDSDAEGNLFIGGSVDTTTVLLAGNRWTRIEVNKSERRVAFIAAFTANKNLLWLESFRGPGSMSLQALYCSEGNVYLAGHVQNERLQYSGMPSLALHMPNAGILARLNGDGSLHYLKSFPSEGYLEFSDLWVNPEQDVYCSGFAMGNADLNPGKEALFLGDDYFGHFFLQLENGRTPLGKPNEDLQSGLLLYPNPGNGSLRIQHAEAFENLKVYNLLGSQVHEEPLAGKSALLKLEHLEKGVYLFHFSGSAGEAIRRYIKE